VSKSITVKNEILIGILPAFRRLKFEAGSWKEKRAVRGE